MTEHQTLPPVRTDLVKQAHWTQWCAWFLVNIALVSLSLLITGYVSNYLAYLLRASLSMFYIIQSTLMGALVGIGQYGLLRRGIPNILVWMLMSIAGSVLGAVTVLNLLHSWVPGAVVIGVLTSVGQWRMLRSTTRQAGWWILVCALPWVLVIWLSVSSCGQYAYSARCSP